MTGLDANILVRYFAQDDANQSPLATEIIEYRLTENNPGYVSLVAMAELVWVLGGTYGLPKQRIADLILRMLQSDTLVIQSEQETLTAAVALQSGHADFADALIGALGKRAGCTSTLTFDRKAARLTDFELA